MVKPYVLVTGSSSGLGQALSKTLCQSQNFHVLGADIISNESNLSNFTFLQTDLSDRNSINKLVEEIKLITEDNLYSIVNVAAISIGKPIDKMEIEDWDRMLQINLSAPAKLISDLQQIIPEGGRIVNISSPVAITGANKPGYSATKAGIHGLTMAVAKTLGERNILVNTVFPGPMITSMTKNWNKEKRKSIAKESFLGRLTTPEEVANGVKFLIDPSTDGITGSIVDFTAGSMFTH